MRTLSERNHEYRLRCALGKTPPPSEATRQLIERLRVAPSMPHRYSEPQTSVPRRDPALIRAETQDLALRGVARAMAVACDGCGEELYDVSQGVEKESHPPQFSVACPRCGFSGYMVR
jgi:hypothetical protein